LVGFPRTSSGKAPTHLPHAPHAASRTGQLSSLKQSTSASSSRGTNGATAAARPRRAPVTPALSQRIATPHQHPWCRAPAAYTRPDVPASRPTFVHLVHELGHARARRLAHGVVVRLRRLDVVVHHAGCASRHRRAPARAWACPPSVRAVWVRRLQRECLQSVVGRVPSVAHHHPPRLLRVQAHALRHVVPAPLTTHPP
jgi:hypothetical protein